MEAPIVLEILDRFGKVKERHRLERFPVRIGRGYDNDIIIDDPYISPRHVEIIQDDSGHILITDLKSENGLFSLHPLQRHEILTAEDNQRLRLGHTDIRLRPHNFPVRETYIDHVRPSRLHLLFTNVVMLPVVWLLSAVIFGLYYYQSSFRDVTAAGLVSQILPLFIFILLWSAAWSIVSKLVTHKFYFAYHAIITALIMACYYLIDPLFEYVEFAYSVNGLADMLNLILVLTLPAILIYGNLRQSTTLSRRGAGITGMMTSFLIIGAMHLITYLNQPDFDAQPEYSEFLKAPMFDPHHGQSINQFFADTKPLSQFTVEQDTPPGQNKAEHATH
ncbi:MAG: FHA domain-containing protein [Gammaproteobacteria bacterium]|jgi:hypothetical protein